MIAHLHEGPVADEFVEVRQPYYEVFNPRKQLDFTLENMRIAPSIEVINGLYEWSGHMCCGGAHRAFWFMGWRAGK